METKVIIANILCIIPYTIMIVYTFLNTKRKTIIACNVITTALFGIQYIILEAYSGAFISFFSSIMYIIFSFKGKNKLFKTWIIPVLYSIVFIIIGIFTYDGILSLGPTLCALISVYSMWLDNEFVIKVSNIPISILWIIYDIIVIQYVGIVGQAVLLVMDIVFIFLYFNKYRYVK